MDKRIISLHSGKKDEELKALLSEKADELQSILEQRILKGSGDPTLLISAIFAGSPCSDPKGVQRRLTVYNTCISILQTSELSNKQANMIVQSLILEVDSLPSACLADLASGYIDSVKHNKLGSGRSLELLPKLLSALQALDTVDEVNMSGPQYKGHLINSLCANRWHPSSVVHLATMFKDVSLSQDELKFVLSKLLRLLPDLESQMLPPLVYQIMLLTAKGHKKMALEGLMRHFAKEDKKYKEQCHAQKDEDLSESSAQNENLHHIEGTIILHITFAVKQDQDLGKVFVKLIKSDTSDAMNPFTIALALSLAQIHCFEEQIFDLLKSLILRSLKDASRRAECHWAQQMSPQSADIAEILMDTVHNSMVGWDHVTQGLVQLGFILLDAFAPKGAFGRPVEVVNVANPPPTQAACQLGSKIVLETFKVHKIARGEILDQILNRIMIKATSPVIHLIDLLSKLASSHPLIVMESQSKVREVLDYLAFLPLTTAEGLLKALQPLLRVSPTLRDAIILILRKAMFSRQVEARQVAVLGFLLILKNFKILGGFSCSQSSQSSYGSCSQVQVDIHQPYTASSNEALCLEIIGNLRRCLSQQADVRMTLYQGLNDVLGKNQQLCRPVLSVLLSQWKRYYDARDDVNPPVDLSKCISTQESNIHVVEPLSHLLSCLCQCLITASLNDEDDDNNNEEEEDESDLYTEFDDILASLTRRMIKSDLEDFELDKSADFSSGSSVGVKNTIYALLVLGIYEDLMEYTFTTGNYEKASSESVITLYDKFQRLHSILRDKPQGSSGGGKRGRPAASSTSSTSSAAASVMKSHKSLVSLRFVNVMVRALFSDTTPSRQESLAILRESQEFKCYILSIALQMSVQISQTGKCDGPEGQNKEKIVKFCTSTARSLLGFYLEDMQTAGDGRSERQKVLALTALETFSTIIDIMCKQYSPQILDFIANLDRNKDSVKEAGEADDVLNTLLLRHIKKYERLVISVLTNSDADHSPKEAVLLLSVIGNLTKLIPSDGELFAQVQNWVFKLCTEQTLDDAALCKASFTLLLNLTSQMKSCVPLLRDIGRDIHSKLGDIDAEVELEQENTFAGINERMAAPTVLSLLLSHIDRQLDHTDWVIEALKCNALADKGEEDPIAPTQAETQEKSVCLRLGHLVNGFHELVQSALPVGQCVENLLKSLTKLYSSLVLLTKYYLALYQQKTGHMSTRFEKLVKLSSANLTQYVYTFISYIQTTQSEQLQATEEKNKKKKKKDTKKAAPPAGKALVMKETRSIPNLIFAIEQYERFLIQLSNKSKVNLMDHFKISTSRDFRINANSLQQALESRGHEGSDDDDDDSKQGDNDKSSDSSDAETVDGENEPPPAKKKKSSLSRNRTKKA